MNLSALNFTGKTVWVTGAYQGIGREIALAFASLGAEVFGFDQKFKAGGEDALGFHCVHMDLGCKDSIDRTLVETLARSSRLDVLVNAAGILRMGSVETLSADAWQETFDVNVRGVFLTLKHAVPLLKRQRFGAIINIGSNAAHVPRSQMVGYGAAKAALTSLSQSVGLELAPYGVRCNTISPGSTETPMQWSMWQSADDRAKVIAGAPEQYKLGIPLGKLASPADIANLAVFLASDLAGHIILQDIVVDGGATLGA